MNILAIGAHPDDLEVGCGGTLARYREAGEHVVMCVVTDGRSHPIDNPDRIAAMRRAEAQASADIIGAELLWLGIPDGSLAHDLPAKRRFVEVMLQVQPDIILTHPPDDYHTDHNTTSRLVMDTIQMAWAPPAGIQGEPVRKQVPVGFMVSAVGLNYVPDDYVDITSVWQTKLDMTAQHRTQYLPGPEYNASPDDQELDQTYLFRLTRVMAEFYGLACWSKYAEPFRWWRAADRIVPRRLLP
jgi:LmbE family N-acetylglucosaminyl deacetylase